MNEIIATNRHKIDNACSLCFFALSKYNDAVQAFHAERRRIDPLPYVQEEKERMANSAVETLGQVAAAQYKEIHDNLESIRAAAGEMEKLLDIGGEFQNALAVVKSLGKALPADVRLSLVEPFKGQKQALSMLKAAYEAEGITSEYYFKDLIFDASVQVDKLDEMAYRVAVEAGDNLLVAAAFARELEAFAAALGVELSRRFSDVVDTDAAVMAQLRTAAGLGAAD